MSDDRSDPLAKAVRSLTVAVWVLCAVGLGILGFYAFSFFQSRNLWRDLSSGANRRSQKISESITREVGPDATFHQLPPDEKIKRASVILLTEWRRDGGEFKSVITEVVKHRPGTTFYYSVGDEFDPLGGVPVDTRIYEDGQVAFLTGSPASMRFATSLSKGRISGFGDMPLSKLRELARQQN